MWNRRDFGNSLCSAWFIIFCSSQANTLPLKGSMLTRQNRPFGLPSLSSLSLALRKVKRQTQVKREHSSKYAWTSTEEVEKNTMKKTATCILLELETAPLWRLISGYRRYVYGLLWAHCESGSNWAETVWFGVWQPYQRDKKRIYICYIGCDLDRTRKYRS